MKQCTRCKKILPESDFYKRKDRKNGTRCYCKYCCKIVSKDYRNLNYDNIIKKIKEWKLKNKERVKIYRNIWKEKNIERYKYLQKKHIQKWRNKNREKIKEYLKKTKNYRNYKKREKYKKNPKYRIDKNIGTAIWLCLNGKKKFNNWEKLVGYTIENLIKHLEK